MNKVSSAINCFYILTLVILISSCTITHNTRAIQKQELATISYKAFNSGVLFLAGESKCRSFLWERYSDRELEPIVRSSISLDVNNAVKIPASESQTFLATTETMLGDTKLKLWFKFPVIASKSYDVFIKTTEVDKKLFNLGNYQYTSYEYSVGVIDEKGQAVSVEAISPVALDAECKAKAEM